MSEKISESGNSLYDALCNGAPVRIISFGDSIADGCGATKPEYKWTNLLCGMISQQYNSHVFFKNYAVGGTDAFFGYHKIKTLTDYERADAVLVCFGQNDASPDSFGLYYEALLWGITMRFPGAKIFCLLESSQRAYTSVIETCKDLAERYHCGIIDTINAFDVSGKSYDQLSSDGVHVNDVGQRIYAETAFKEIGKYMKEGQPVSSLCCPKNSKIADFDRYCFIPAERMSCSNDAYTYKIGNGLIGFDCIETPNGGEYSVLINGTSVRTATFKHNFEWSWERAYPLGRVDTGEATVKIVLANPADEEFFKGIFVIG